MTSLLSFSWRRAQETNRHHHQRATANIANNVNRPENDPWSLGIATSTSSADSLVIRHNHSSGEDTQVSTVERVRTIPVPTTPEGLRPRKSIHKVRQELLGYSQDQDPASTRFRYKVAESPVKSLHSSCVSKPTIHAHSILTTSCLPTSFTCEHAPVLQCQRESPQTTLHSSMNMSVNYDYYEQAEHVDDDFDDIVSTMASPSFSRHGSYQKVAMSPDLKPGKAKTAVGAVLAAMAEHGKNKYSLGSEVCSPTRNDKAASNEGSQHSILPSREWMEHEDDKDFVVGEDTLREEIPQDNLDDNESSMHASPSSNAWRPGRFTTWQDRQAQFQQDTSFTRNILSQDPNASWQQGHGKDNQPYDFEPILSEEEALSLKDSIDAPRVLDLIHDHGGLNVSAISSSYHPRDMGSLHSLADTMEDDEEEQDYNQINRYQPLIDDTMLPGEDVNDDALLLLKANNQRRIKEHLLLSTLERLFDDSGLLKEFCAAMERRSTKCPSPRNNFLLGLDESERTRIIQEIESILTKLSVDSDQESLGTERLALHFCFMVFQMPMNASKSRVDDIYAPRHHWKPLPGFRVALGLEEEPASPPTVRGGDSSLFSLPSDSANANDDTPHTSNVSMATTITTVISPEKKSSQRHLPNAGLLQTLETVVRLLGRVEAACLLLVTVDGKLKTALDEIKQIYLEFLQLPVSYLRSIIYFFELHYEYPPLTATVRTVSADYEEKTENFHHKPNYASQPGILLPPVQPDAARNALNMLVTQTGIAKQDTLRIKVVENEGEGIGQEVECDLWTPKSQGMNSYVRLDDDGPSTIACIEDSGSRDDEERGTIDDLRRTVGSFDELRRPVDLESVQEERDGTPSEDDNVDNDLFEEEMILATNDARRNNFAGAASRWRTRGFWKGRVLGSRQRQFRCTE